MSDNSHIDKIFREGLGERNFSNVDAMWQRMEADLGQDDRRKKRPVAFFLSAAALITVAFLSYQYFNPSTVHTGAANETAVIVTPLTNKADQRVTGNTSLNIPGDNAATTASGKAALPQALAGNTTKTTKAGDRRTVSSKKKYRITTVAPSADTTPDDIVEAAMPVEGTDNGSGIAGSLNERIEADASVLDLSVPAPAFTNTIPSLKYNSVNTAAAFKKEVVKPRKIMVEFVAGRDFLRMNRTAGSYMGVRVNRYLDNGTSVTIGANYATHMVQDRYRNLAKPAGSQKTWDARLNNIGTIRLPVYLQRQMGKSKLSMMIGLVPTFITHAEVYNVPGAYAGNPDLYRQFTVNDLNRFNLLFGAGLKYAPTKWMAIEVSGNYGLTGMVKDGYKNQSRVNDNFKSLQAGFAFRLW